MSNGFRSSEVCDALDALGLSPKIVSGLMAFSGDALVDGPAQTLRITHGRSDPSSAGASLRQMIETTPADAVLVLDARAIRFAVWGGLMTAAALGRGVRGLICAGLVRDLTEASARIPIFAAGVSPLRAAHRCEMIVTQQPVAIGGVMIETGDHVYADRDGIVVVPAADALAVEAGAYRVRERESIQCSR
jgi:4-hydroxy-4-methyl-2-oxoglutarate aldolase